MKHLRSDKEALLKNKSDLTKQHDEQSRTTPRKDTVLFCTTSGGVMTVKIESQSTFQRAHLINECG